MTKDEMIKALKEANALNVKNANDTLQNIETKEVSAPVAKAEGLTGLDSELPTQKAIEKEVAKDEGPLVPADKDGVSKNGGECEKLMSADGVEAERKKEDNGMKDVINVSSRKVEEADEVSNELLKQLKESAAREEALREQVKKLNALCEKALASQHDQLNKSHAEEMKRVFESVIKAGEESEKQLKESVAKNEKMYKTAQKLYENSNKLNKILLEAVKKAQPKKEMARYMTPAMRAASSLGK